MTQRRGCRGYEYGSEHRSSLEMSRSCENSRSSSQCKPSLDGVSLRVLKTLSIRMVQRKSMAGFLQVKLRSPVRVFGSRASMMKASVDNDNSEIALDCRQLAPDHEVEIVVDEPF